MATSIDILNRKVEIERKIDELIKERQIHFDHMKHASPGTSEYRRCNAIISSNTRKIRQLRDDWREVDTWKKTKPATASPIGLFC